MSKSYKPLLPSLRAYLNGMNMHQIGSFRRLLDERLPNFLEMIAEDARALYPGVMPGTKPLEDIDVNVKKQEVSKNIAKMAAALPRLQTDLDRLTTQEQETLKEIDESMLAGDGGGSAGSLVELRIRKESATRAVELAKSRLEQGKKDLSDIELAERAARWTDVEADLRGRLAKVRSLVGEAGLAGELRQMYRTMAENESIARLNHGGENFTYQIRSLCNDGLKDLFDLWKLIDHIDHPSLVSPAQDASGKYVGFGELPNIR